MQIRPANVPPGFTFKLLLSLQLGLDVGACVTPGTVRVKKCAKMFSSVIWEAVEKLLGVICCDCSLEVIFSYLILNHGLTLALLVGKELEI